MRTALAIGLAIAVQTAFAGSARADEIVGVLHLETKGVSETAAEKFETSIEEGLAGTGFKVAPRKRLKELLASSSYIDGCHFGPCLEEVYRNTKVRLVLVGRIVSLGPSYSFVVSLLDTRTGRPISQVADICDVCTLEEAIATAALAVIEAVTRSGAMDEGPTAKLAPDPGKHEREVRSLKKKAARSRRVTRRAAVFFLAAAALAGGAGAYLITSEKNERLGYASAATGGAFVVTSGTLLLISLRF